MGRKKMALLCCPEAVIGRRAFGSQFL